MNNDIMSNLKRLEHYFPVLKAILKSRGNEPEMPISSLSDLNNMIWGLPKGKLTVVAARTSVGKSAFSLQMAYDLALHGKRVLFLSLEMTVEDLLERLFCYENRINNRHLTRGQFGAYEQKYDSFCQDLGRLKLAFTDCIGKHWSEVEEILTALDPKPDAVFIDHINAIRVDGANAKRVIDDYLLNLVRITKHNNISMIICCQINRDNQKDDDKTPQLHELKGSGNLEEMADRVIMLHWPHRYQRQGENIPKNKYIVIVGKNRSGPTGYINVHFEPEFGIFSNARKTEKDLEQARDNSQLQLLNQMTE